MPKTILLIEDDAETRQMLATALASQGHRVLEADTGETGLHQFRTLRPDLALLDVNLPDMNGFQICASMRQHPELGATPIVMLTGRSEMEAKSIGFSSGADHYFVKPVDPAELLLWVAALFRRQELDRGEGGALKAGALSIDPKGQLVQVDGQVLEHITGREFDLLHALVKARPRVLSRKFILSKVWRTVATDNVVDAHIRNLRRKLPQTQSDRLQTVPGRGFRYLG